jgi:hypothetical protein
MKVKTTTERPSEAREALHRAGSETISTEAVHGIAKDWNKPATVDIARERKGARECTERLSGAAATRNTHADL